ncbi:hypothetical protein V1505DRAFT_388151 [Lipomyces doorenjongii]
MPLFELPMPSIVQGVTYQSRGDIEKCKAVEYHLSQSKKRKLQRPLSRSRVRSSQVPSSEDAIVSSRITIANLIETPFGLSTNFRMVASCPSEFTTDSSTPSTRVLCLPDLEQMKLAYILESPNLQHGIESNLPVIAPETHGTKAPDPCQVDNAAKLLLRRKKGARKIIHESTAATMDANTAVTDAEDFKNYYREGPQKYFFQKLSYVPLDELHYRSACPSCQPSR